MKSPKTSNLTFRQFLKNSRTWFVLVEHSLISGRIRCTLEPGVKETMLRSREDRIFEARRLKKEIREVFPEAQVNFDLVDEWLTLEVDLPPGVRVAQVAPLPVAPSAEGSFYKNPQFKEVRQFAETGAVTNIPAVAAEAAKKDNLDLPKRETVSDAKKAPPTPEEISHAPGGKGVSTLNRLVVDSVDPKAEKAIPGNEAKMPKTSALEINNSKMRAWLEQVYPR